MNTTPYKEYQQLYDMLVTVHSDDLSNTPHVTDDEIVQNALAYFKERTFPLVYPAKSYAVAIIYATVLSKHYGIDFYGVLNDADLFLGGDDHFVTYDEDKETYDAILEGLKDIPDWLESGWAPYTVKYCLLECTVEGIDEVSAGMA